MASGGDYKTTRLTLQENLLEKLGNDPEKWENHLAWCLICPKKI